MSHGIRQMLTYTGESGLIQAYLARPETGDPRPAVIVIHEIYGLNDHIKSVADRFAKSGFVALAPQLYSRADLVETLTPGNIEEATQFQFSLPREKMGDSAYIQQAVADLPSEKRQIVQKTLPVLFNGLPMDKMTQDLVKAIDFLNAQSFVKPGKIASVGFCFGGGMSFRLACHAPLAACVVFYGQNPEPIELVENITCPVLGLYGAEDMRVNANLDKLVRSMVANKKDFEMRIYPGAAHAFFNDTRPQVYRENAAKDAWDRVTRFYRQTLIDI